MFVRNVLGVGALVIGLLGLLLPVLPGIPFLIVAVLLLTRGDGHWRRRAARWSAPMDDWARDDLRPFDRARLGVLRGVGRTVEALDRAERRLRGAPPPPPAGLR
jgi:hypothetical protein